MSKDPDIVKLITEIEGLLEQMDFRMRDIGKAGMFTPEEEQASFRNYSVAKGRKKTEIRNDIVKKNMKLVAQIANRWTARAKKKTGMEVSELFNQGILGLIKAIEQFSPRKGTKFSTFATPKIEGSIRDFLKKPFRTSKYEEPEEHGVAGDEGEEVVSKIDRFLATKSKSPEDMILGKVSIRQLIKKLEPKEAEAIKLRYLEGLSLEKAGRRMGLSRERVNQYEKRALKKMKGMVR